MRGYKQTLLDQNRFCLEANQACFKVTNDASQNIISLRTHLEFTLKERTLCRSIILLQLCETELSAGTILFLWINSIQISSSKITISIYQALLGTTRVVHFFHLSLNPGFLLAQIQQNLKLILLQFDLKIIHNNTMTFRSMDSFYQLSSLLKSHHPWLSVPPLPLRPSFWISSVRQVFLGALKMMTR